MAVRVDFAAAQPGHTSANLNIICNGKQDTAVPIAGDVIRQRLLLQKPGRSETVAAQDIGYFYYNTTRSLRVTIYNDRPCATDFYTKLERQRIWVYTANGREGCDTFTDTLDIVQVQPAEGHLAPQEKMVLTITVNPKLTAEQRQISRVRFFHSLHGV